MTDEKLAGLDDIANLRLSEEDRTAGYRLDIIAAIQVRDVTAKQHFAELVSELRQARSALSSSRAECEELRKERDKARSDVRHVQATLQAERLDHISTLGQAAELEAEARSLRRVCEIARRWCTRPESALREGAQVLANDTEMWLKLRAAVSATKGPADE